MINDNVELVLRELDEVGIILVVIAYLIKWFVERPKT